MNSLTTRQFPYLLFALLLSLSACSAVQRVSDTAPQARGFLELLVEPNTAEIFVDEEYNGVVAGWYEQIVPVPPGMRKIELRAPGYITQRFDLDFHADEQITLELKMQPELPDLDDETPEKQTKHFKHLYPKNAHPSTAPARPTPPPHSPAHPNR